MSLPISSQISEGNWSIHYFRRINLCPNPFCILIELFELQHETAFGYIFGILCGAHKIYVYWIGS